MRLELRDQIVREFILSLFLVVLGVGLIWTTFATSNGPERFLYIGTSISLFVVSGRAILRFIHHRRKST